MSAILPVRSVAKPWGRDVLPPPFHAPAGERIGEIWFEPPPALDQLLIKYIFTSEALSVQVHPSDAQRPGDGKEECWLIVSAEPDAKLGIGFTEAIDGEAMRAAALDGSIEHLLAWHPVRAGDFFYIPANTVHAIGAGIGLIEVQQNSDVTYRLYDYGRPRELHLDEGIAVAQGAPYPDRWRDHLSAQGEQTLVDGPLFRLDRVDGEPSDDVRRRYGTAPVAVIPSSGTVRIAGEEVAPGACAVAPLAEMQFAGQALIAQPCAA